MIVSKKRTISSILTVLLVTIFLILNNSIVKSYSATTNDKTKNDRINNLTNLAVSYVFDELTNSDSEKLNSELRELSIE